MKLQREMNADLEDVRAYARLVSDHNPLHVSEDYVESDGTFSDENIVHGSLILGWFSGVLNDLGDSGAMNGEVILVNMNADFQNPLPVGTDATIEAEVPPEQMPDTPTEKVMLDVLLEAKSRDGLTYAAGSATIMVDQTVDQHEHR